MSPSDAKPSAPSVFRPGGITYLRIPTTNPGVSAAFYADVFGWQVRGGEDPAFTDGSGHVIGHWQADLAVVGEAGVIPYVYTDDIDATLARAAAAGGQRLAEPYQEGDLWVATVRDPVGNVVGVWQQGMRPSGPGGSDPG